MPSLCYNIARSDVNIHSYVWKKPIAKDLYQSTVGILGLSVTGKVVARRLKGPDCHILVFDSYYDEAFIRGYDIYKANIDEIVSSGDFLTLHFPALVEFLPLPDAKTSSKMKKDTVIIDTARAKFVDRQALYGTLHNGQLYGYGSDVHYMEPGLGEELIACENTVLTPHTAAGGKGAINRMSDTAVDHVLTYFGCQQPLGN